MNSKSITLGLLCLPWLCLEVSLALASPPVRGSESSKIKVLPSAVTLTGRDATARLIVQQVHIAASSEVVAKQLTAGFQIESADPDRNLERRSSVRDR